MKKISFVLLISVIAFAACSKKASPAKTAKVVPTTFTADILPLTMAKCTPCHGKGSNKGDFLTYESAKKFAPEMLDRVMIAPGGRGFMPKNHDKLADTEIALIKKWIDGGLLEK
jgi:cytochrome c553